MRDLPADWKLATLGEISKGPGQYGSGAAAIGHDPALPRYVRITDIGPRGGLNSDTCASIDWVDAKPHMLAEGDLLFARSGATVGKTYLYEQNDGPCAYAGYVIKFAIDESVALPAYVNYWTHSEGYWSWVNRTLRAGAQPNINAVEYGRHLLPIPPLAEQRRIVEIICAVDKQIRSLNRVIAKIEMRENGLVEDVLARIDVPFEPLSAYLADRPKNGYSPVEVDYWTGTKALGLGCLTRRGFSPVQLKNVPGRDGRNLLALLSDGDLLISRANTRELVGMVGIYRNIGTPCIYPDLMMKLVANDRCIPEFLELILRSSRVRRQIQAYAQGTSESMVKISSGIVCGLKVQIPEIAVQREIMAVVLTCRSDADRVGGELRKLQNLRLGLVEDLMAGRVRV